MMNALIELLVPNLGVGKGSVQRHGVAKEIRRLRRIHGRNFSRMWAEAAKDYDAEVELQMCEDVPAPFVMKEELEAYRRFHRTRTAQEDEFLRLLRKARKYNLRHKVKLDVERQSREIGIRVAAMVPYGR